jgi:hypothetical protein
MKVEFHMRRIRLMLLLDVDSDNLESSVSVGQMQKRVSYSLGYPEVASVCHFQNIFDPYTTNEDNQLL